MNTPINSGLLQSDIDFAGYKPLNADLSDYDVGGGGGGGGTTPQITVNVKDDPYNAVGNGVVDDTDAINEAIQAVFDAGGGVVYFPKGIYQCDGAVTATANSVITIPKAANPLTIELIGEVQPAWGVASTFDLSQASTIRTATTGTYPGGSYPALIAGSLPRGQVLSGDYANQSATFVKIRNMNFILPDDPVLNGVRLDGVGSAIVEDCNVMTVAQSSFVAAVEPTHGSVGMWMPNSINWGVNYMNRVVVTGFDTGFMVGEHLRAPSIMAYYCKTCITFLEAMYPSWANIIVGMCPDGIRFLGWHCVDLLVEVEGSGSGWTLFQHDVVDASNYGMGQIRFYIGHGTGGLASITPTISGGSGLTIVDLSSGNITQNTTQGASGGPSYLKSTSVRLNAVTVTNLPASPVVGQVASVSDGTAALAWGATVTGGGSTKYLVFYNGTNWTVMGK